MNNWYERAEEQIERDLSEGLIDSAEYLRQMRDLRAELRAEAQEAAERAYNDAMGG